MLNGTADTAAMQSVTDAAALDGGWQMALEAIKPRFVTPLQTARTNYLKHGAETY